MAFDPVAFHTLAYELHQQAARDSSESKRRSAISRAYYSAFLAARDRAGVSNHTAQVHEDVKNYYLSRDPQIGNLLKDLRIARNEADYDLGKTPTASMSSAAIKQADKVLYALGLKC